MAGDGQVFGDVSPMRHVIHQSFGDGSAKQGTGVFSDTANPQEDFLFFSGSITVPAATVLGTGTLATLLTAAGPSLGNAGRRCPKGYKFCLTNVQIKFSGATVWAAGTDLRLSDSSSTVDFLTLLPAASAAGYVWNFPLQLQGVVVASQTASAGGNTTITGTGFTANALNGKWVVITGGVGAGQARLITTNTTTVLTVAQWLTNPDSTSVFVVVENPALAMVTQNVGPKVYSTVDNGLIVRATGTFTTGTAFDIYVEGYYVKSGGFI